MLDDEICYRAICARDPRFDGRFFTGVLTTGVYCRPICPSRTPCRSNCRFFAVAAAAREEGFRPCKRCRPEGAPGLSTWQGTSDTVAMALKLISAPGDVTTGELASHLSVGDRHLRRLFVEHLGTTPGALIRTRRLGFAAKLLGETQLPVSTVAFASGFRSIRRFNEVMKEAYGLAPRDLRRRTGDRVATSITLSLSYRPPYDWEQVCTFIGSRLLPGSESLEGGTYRRLVRAGSGVGCISVSKDPARDQLVLVCEGIPHDELMDTMERTRRMFDLDADIDSVETTMRDDPALRSLVKVRRGLRLPVAWTPFEAGVRAIIGQRISVKAARTMTTRLLRKFGKEVQGWESYGLDRTFLGAEDLIDADLASIGLTAARQQALRALAAAFADGSLPSAPAMGADALIGKLERVQGIGAWTANYVAMRGYGEPDAFPHTDLGVTRACRALGIDSTPANLLARADRWRPWRSYAVMHLWAHTSE